MYIDNVYLHENLAILYVCMYLYISHVLIYSVYEITVAIICIYLQNKEF